MTTPGSEIPLAMASLPELRSRLGGRRLALFLDYDGTLTPIIQRPELAFLSQEARDAVRRVAARVPTAIVSGRALADVAALAGMDELIYAGNHGLEIRGPRGSAIAHEPGEAFVEDVARFAARAAARVSLVEGARIEDKRLSLTIHHRMSPPEQVPRLEAALDELIAGEPRLRKHRGKMVFEVRPALDWHKGKAVLWLLRELGLDGTDAAAVYVGDDVTDEDAFRALDGRGVGVLVAPAPQPTAAHYRLRVPAEVPAFLDELSGLAG